MRKSDLDTPCLTLDLEALDRNVHGMQSAATRAGKALRPHAKTHKCSTLAKRQLAAGALGVCVAKVSEAEALLAAGVRGILVTGPVAIPGKIRRLVNLVRVAPDTMVVVDHATGADLLEAALREQGLTMDVLLDVDVGLHRTGVVLSEAPRLAEHIRKLAHLRLRGLQAYAGHLQHLPAHEERRRLSLACLTEAATLFRELRKAQSHFSIFSATGTGTADIDLDIPELSELQVGSYVCMDTEYLSLGSPEDPRRFTTYEPVMRLLTTVVSANQHGFVTVDAGLKAIYRDGGYPRIVCPDSPGLAYDWFGDEYGRVTCAAPSAAPRLGEVLELVVPHCDPTVNLFDSFMITQGDEVVDRWPIDLRGCSQ